MRQSVQNFAYKIISWRWDWNYEKLINFANMSNLRNRQCYLNLAQLYKIVYCFCYIPDDTFNIHSFCLHRLQHSVTIKWLFACTNYYYNSFVPSIIRAWNSLDEAQVTAESFLSFKCKITSQSALSFYYHYCLLYILFLLLFALYYVQVGVV